MKEILEILQKNARTTPEEIARMLKKKTKDIKAAIKKFKTHILLGRYINLY